MKQSNVIALAGLAIAAYAAWRANSARGGQPPASPGLRRSRRWYAAGIDPFGASYTVEKTAAAGGLNQ